MSELIKISQANEMITIGLNRPEKRNALNGQLIQALSEALQITAQHKQTRVLLIHGNGDHFCAGADIGWMQQIAAGSYEDNYADAKLLAELIYQLYTFPIPTIVLAHGATVGGGLGLLSACDIAVAAKSAMFGFAEVKMGIIPAIVSPYVINAIGARMAHYYFLTGERFGVDEAHRIGLVHQVAEDGALMSVGLSLATTIMQNAPQALTAAKKLIRDVAKEKITAQLANKTAELLASLRASKEGQEGLQAFMEKRHPNWNDV